MKNNKNEQKLFIKIFSVFVAIVLWLFISYNENNSMDVKVKSIEVQYTGEEELLAKGLMIADKSSVPDLAVKIRGKRSDLIPVLNDVTATVDVSQIEETGSYKLTPNFNIPSDTVYVSKTITQNVEVRVIKTAEKIIDVDVILQNTEKNKAHIIEAVPEFEKMKIKGEKNDIDAIEKAVLYVDASTIVENGEISVSPVYETKDSKEAVTQNDIFADRLRVRVKNNVYFRKTATVKIELPMAEDGKYFVSLVGQSADKIEIGVKNSEENPPELTADFENISELKTGKNKYTLEIKASDGVYIPKESRYTEVEVDVEEIKSEKIEVPISVKNENGMKYQLKTQSVSVEVSGPENLLNKENITAELDLSKVSENGGRLDIKSKNKNVKINSEPVFVEIMVE